MPRPNKSADKIVDALIELMKSQDYNSISISDVTSAADVSRICFYRNFDSKEAVLDRFIDRVVRNIQSKIDSLPSMSSLEDYFLILFQSIGQYSAVIREICHSNLSSMILRQFNDKLFRTPLEKKGIVLDHYQRKFYTGAFYNVLIEWIMTGMREPAESIASMCSHLTV